MAKLAALLLVGLLVTPPPATGQAEANSLGLSATYDVAASINYRRAKITVDTTATVANPYDEPVTQLSFNLVPLSIGAAVVESVTVDGLSAVSSVDDVTLVVTLPTPLAAGQTQVRIVYRASLEPNPIDRNGYFRKANGIISAGRWIPWLSRRVAFSRPTMGTPFVTATAARVDVRLTVGRTDMKYATSGQRTAVSADGKTQTFVAFNVRDFVFAAAPNYLTRTMQVGPTTVTLYYRKLKADRVMSRARAAIEFYTAKIGPYPWPTLTMAETSGPMAAEWPSAVWFPTGGATSYLVAHEIAHQWFYSAVGNDQAAEPFADEAPAELLTRLLTSTMRASKCPEDTLDRSIYEYTDACYFETIYVQGALYLDDYRLSVGDGIFWAGVRAYFEAQRFELAGTRQLLDALDAASGRDPSLHAARFPRLYAPAE